MEGIVNEPHPKDNVTKHITPKNDLIMDLMEVEKFTRENFTLWKFQKGIMVCVKETSSIIDGTKKDK
jgi:hypothetical protein